MKLAKALTIFMLTAASLPALSAKTVKVDIGQGQYGYPCTNWRHDSRI